MPHNWESSAWNWTNAIRAGKAVNSTCWSAVKQKLFTSEQAKVCIRHPGAMLSVWEAAFAASQACRDAFAERRWNCSSVGHLPKKTPDLTRGELTLRSRYELCYQTSFKVRESRRGCTLWRRRRWPKQSLEDARRGTSNNALVALSHDTHLMANLNGAAVVMTLNTVSFRLCYTGNSR